MYCNSCGKELNDGASFCRYCGSKLEFLEAEDVSDEIEKELSEEEAEKKEPIDKDKIIQNKLPFENNTIKDAVEKTKEPFLTKKGKKKIIILVIVAVLVIVAIVTAALIIYNATKHKCGANLSWDYDRGTKTLTISGTGDMYDSNREWSFNESGEISYASGTGLSFDDLKWNTEQNETGIETVIIEDGCTGIGKSAFGLFYMKKVVLPNTLERIGDYSFCGCDYLEEINIPASVTYIGQKSFKRNDDTDVSEITINYSGTKEQWNSFASEVEFIGVVKCANGDIRHGSPKKAAEEKFIGSWEERDIFGTWEIATIPEDLIIEKSNENTSNEMRTYKFVSDIKNHYYKMPYGELSISRGNNQNIQNGQRDSKYTGTIGAYRLFPPQINDEKNQLAKMGKYPFDYKFIDNNTIVADTSNTASDSKNITTQDRITIKYNADNDTIVIENHTDFNNNVVSTYNNSVTDRSKAIGITYKRKDNDGVFAITLNSDHTGTKTKAYGSEGVDTINWSIENINDPNIVVIYSSEDNYNNKHYLRYDTNTGRLIYEGYESKVKYILTKK